MNELILNNSIFENIKHIDENGNEYWLARELQNVLDYKEWRKFSIVLEKAKISCQISNLNIEDHFVGADKMVVKQKKIEDYKLSRYACYLIA